MTPSGSGIDEDTLQLLQVSFKWCEALCKWVVCYAVKRDVKSIIVYDISATSYVYFLTALPNDVFAEIIMYFIKNTGKELHCYNCYNQIY